LLASPHFDLHLPFWVILPRGAGIACMFGALLGAPTLKLRGDYLAIVTLGFGEIVRIFRNNLSQPVNITADMVQEDWNEARVTWDQQPLTTDQVGAATWQPGQAGPLVIDLTEAARTWYACGGASNDGIQLSADLSGDWVVFGSRKSAYPPMLDVTYEATSIPLDCTAAPTASAPQPPSQPAPSTSGAQIGAVTIAARLVGRQTVLLRGELARMAELRPALVELRTESARTQALARALSRRG